VFLSTRAWKVVGGAILSAAAQLAVAWFYYGIEPLREWGRMLLHVREVMPLLEPKPYQTHSLRTFWSMLLPWPQVSFALYGLSACVVLALTVNCWKRKRAVPLGLRYSVLLLATVLVSPHLTIYDLVVLAPAFFLLADWLVAQPRNLPNRSLADLLYLSAFLPLLGPLDVWTHLRLSVLAMSALLYVVWHRRFVET
jgi:hypothetical protein